MVLTPISNAFYTFISDASHNPLDELKRSTPNLFCFLSIRALTKMCFFVRFIYNTCIRFFFASKIKIWASIEKYRNNENEQNLSMELLPW